LKSVIISTFYNLMCWGAQQCIVYYLSKHYHYPMRELPASERTIIRLLKHGLTTAEVEDKFSVRQATSHAWYARGAFSKTEAAVIGKVLYMMPKAVEREIERRYREE